MSNVDRLVPFQRVAAGINIRSVCQLLRIRSGLGYNINPKEPKLSPLRGRQIGGNNPDQLLLPLAPFLCFPLCVRRCGLKKIVGPIGDAAILTSKERTE